MGEAPPRAGRGQETTASGPPLHREHRDHAARKAFVAVPGATLRRFGIPSAPLVRELSAVIPEVETAATVVDVLREASDGVIWHLEFETGSGDPIVLARHHLAVLTRYPQRDVRTVIFWCGERAIRQPLVCGDIALWSRQVRLADIHAEGELARWRQIATRGEAPGDDDILLLALLPLTHLTRPVLEMLPDAVRAFAAVPEATRMAVFRVTVTLAYNQTEAVDRERLREVLGTMPLGQEYLQELEREYRAAEARGREKGIAELEASVRQELRAAIVDMFVSRYGGSPALLSEALGRITDRGRLVRLFQDVALASDAEAARQALGI